MEKISVEGKKKRKEKITWLTHEINWFNPGDFGHVDMSSPLYINFSSNSSPLITE